MSFCDQLLVEDEHSNIRKLILHRPKQLNSLSFQMLSGIREFLIACEKDRNVKLVILKGEGKAFCAGGDMAAVAHAVAEGNWRLGAKHFWNAYLTSHTVATFSKPQVSIYNGLVMGGGAGISVHGRFRVATEKAVFAMPETALGLDAGSSYFLSRLPGFFGEYVGLTGTRLDGVEMLVYGLATHFVPSGILTLLEDELNNVKTSNPTIISEIIDDFSKLPPLKERSVYHCRNIVNKCFSKATVEDILTALETEAAAISREEYWIFEAIRKARIHQATDQCFIEDYRMSCHLLRGDVSKDFFEGCRAILWDKDRKPKWEPSKLELVSDQMVEHYFSKVNDVEWKDLVLPFRPHLRASLMSKI